MAKTDNLTKPALFQWLKIRMGKGYGLISPEEPKSREEIAAMLGLSELKKTRFYQEVFEEGKQEGKQEAKLETVSVLLQLGLTTEQIAEALQLPLELVQQTAQQTP